MRLFIAILPDARMIRALRACVRDLEAQGAQGSIVPDANLHMTLAFIGDAERPDQVRAVLQKIPLPKIRLTLSKTGYFGDLLWVGIKADPSLHAYVSALREALAEADIPFDKKPFVPHITLIRRLRAPGPLCPRLDQAEMEASKAALMCSSFTGGKVQYQEI